MGIIVSQAISDIIIAFIFIVLFYKYLYKEFNINTVPLTEN